MDGTSTVIYRHSIAPTRAFTQLSNELIRHPRLSSDAVRLLTWQLSLPEGARENLSRTAERANINNSAFTRAKKLLKEEGFVHERRMQGPGGRWITQQLVSSTPLSAEQAAKFMAREASPQVVPSRPQPTVGRPTTPPTGGHPKGGHNTGEKTPNLPGPTGAAATTSTDSARTLVEAYRVLDPALSRIPRAMYAELAALTERWLAAGHTPGDVRAHILRGLPADGTPVRHPGGLLRYLLSDVPPVEAAAKGPDGTQGTHGIDRPRVSARLAGLRECEGPGHIQAHLFRPVADEAWCAACRTSPSSAGAEAE
ncbi:hypothetical protein [Streptomyces xanthii]|uniref:hypothetical protein n=1 Tax=Streptomyces xanthii TaxID=2768069 RepID=UPI001CB7A4E8|nr:hypothetical protein [Streptomyces xanthii]